MASGNAIVKNVLSGDTLLLVGKSINGPPPEITITLSNIQTPKLARGPQQNDELFAWHAREFLRKLCIGKQVSFKVSSTISSINRSFGDVYLNNENINKSIIAAGWGTVKDQKDNNEDYDVLVNLYNQAKAAKIGIHTDDAAKKREAVRQVNWSVDVVEYATTLLNQANRSKLSTIIPSIRVIFEHVRDGASFRCYIPSIPGYASVSLAGIVCPRVNVGKSDSDTPSSPEPFALQARHFSELRLLNREVDVSVHGATAGSGKAGSEGSLLVTVSHPKGNITLELVKAGLGKIADWTLALLPKETVVALRAAENEAKSQRRGVWYSFTPPPPLSECRVFEGRVIEVISGDTIIVAERNPEGGFIETRVTFASIKVPRIASNRSGVSEPFSVECKEFVRSRLIGKQVLVAVEYIRDKKIFASVYYGKSARQPSGSTRPGTLISEQLIAEGLAQTVKHRAEEPRAEAYDTMLVDEAEAQKKKKGLHNATTSTNESTTRNVNDLTTDGKKAKAFFGTIQKDKTYRGMVDYVFSGSRFKVTIPSENATILFALSQVRCPNLSKAQPAASATLEEGEVPPTEDPLSVWAETAKKFSRLNVLQRLVDIEFTDVDRNGVMLGKLYVTNEKTPSRTGRATSYAVDLVAEGLASVDKYAINRGGHDVDALVSAQKKAQESTSGLWSVPGALTQTENEQTEEETDKQSSESDVVRVKLTEIYTGSTFAVHINGSASTDGMFAGRGSDILSQIETLLASNADDLSSSPSLVGNVRRGNIVAALYDDPSGSDGSVWLRARVEELVGTDAKVIFIDYGHRADVPISSLRTLTEDLTSFQNQAIDCSLAFLRAPTLGSEHGVPAARALNSLAWDKECMMKVLSSSDANAQPQPKSRSQKSASSSSQTIRYAVVLFALPTNGEELDIENALNVNEKLVRNGFVRISATSARRLRGGRRRGKPYVNETDHSTGSVAADALAVLETAQSQAHSEHLRIWAYGDPGDSDDELEEKRAAA